MASQILQEINKIPAVTRFLCASTLAVSVPVMLQIVSPYKILFVKELVTRKLEVRILIKYAYKQHLTRVCKLWRPFTSLFYAGRFTISSFRIQC